jgi:hypothetical protein
VSLSLALTLPLAFASVVDSADRAIPSLWHWNRVHHGVVMAQPAEPRSIADVPRHLLPQWLQLIRPAGKLHHQIRAEGREAFPFSLA